MSKGTRKKARFTARRIAVGGGSFVAAVVVGAFAAFIASAPLTGTVEAGTFTPQWSGLIAERVGAGAAECGASSPTPTSASINMRGALPGDTCKYTGHVHLSADSASRGRLVSLDLTLPAGFEADLTAGCNATVDRGPGNRTQVAFTVTATDAVTPGASGSLAAGDGVKVEPWSANQANC